jgi:proline iminopeptidase
MKLAAVLATVTLGLTLGACAPEVPEPEEPPGLTNGSFTATLNGFQIHYEVRGRGPVLMTVPNSWGLSLQGLRAMYEPLEERLTLVYFDPRGMGGSEAVREDSDRGMVAVRADFQALRAYLGLETVNAIGWSNGAGNLIFLAHEQPDSLSSAIFVHQGASFTQEDARRVAEANPELAAVFGPYAQQMGDPDVSEEDKAALHRKVWLEDYFPLLFAERDSAQGALNRLYGEAELSWRHAAYSQQEMSTFDATDLLPEIPVRSLVVAGAHDLLPPERLKPLADGLPDSDFVVFEESAHFAAVEEPQAFEVVIFNFLGVLSPPPPVR